MKPQQGHPATPNERKPLLFGCIVLLVAALVLGGAFLLGAWSMTRGYMPPPGQ